MRKAVTIAALVTIVLVTLHAVRDGRGDAPDDSARPIQFAPSFLLG